MDKKMMAMCGTYCETCDWKDEYNCPGCQASQGKLFWGECDKAKCCTNKGYEHCGSCSEVPCQKLTDLFADKEHGDNGTRMTNLHNWAKGNFIFQKLR